MSAYPTHEEGMRALRDLAVLVDAIRSDCVGSELLRRAAERGALQVPRLEKRLVAGDQLMDVIDRSGSWQRPNNVQRAEYFDQLLETTAQLVMDHPVTICALARHVFWLFDHGRTLLRTPDMNPDRLGMVDVHQEMIAEHLARSPYISRLYDAHAHLINLLDVLHHGDGLAKWEAGAKRALLLVEELR